jgi:hypothetical protein
MRRFLFLFPVVLMACAPTARSDGRDKTCPPENASTPVVSTSSSADTDPEAFCFLPALDAIPDPVRAVSSNTITVRGINQPAPLTASPGTTVYVNDAYLEYFNADTPARTVKAGDRVRVLGSASNKGDESIGYTLTIGKVSDTFYIVTKK